MVTWEVPKHSNRDRRYMSAQITSLKALWIEGPPKKSLMLNLELLQNQFEK